MATDIFEGSTLNLKAKVQKGTPKGADVTFTITKPDGGTETKTGKLQSGIGGKFAELKDYVVPDVPDDKENYTLEYKAKVDKEEVTGSTFTVWPHSVTIVSKNKDDDKAYPDFPFKIVQKRKAIRTAKTNSKGEYNCQLKEKAAFEVEAVPPWEVEWQAPKTGRKRTGKISRTFAAEFIAPVPGGEDTKQFVNVKSRKNGQDGFGNRVTIEVGASEEKGVEGDPIYIQVTFGRESKRSTPRPQLLTALEITPDAERKVFKGKVLLGKSGAPAKFVVDLGLAGGDTCEIKIASTEKGRDGDGDAKLKIVNWRKLRYELLYPEAMRSKLSETEVDGKQVRDLPAALKTKVTERLDPAFIAYEVVGANEMDKPPKGSVLKAKFCGGGDSDPDVFVLTPHFKTKLPTSKFKSSDKRCIRMSLCDRMFASNDELAIQQPVLDAATKDHPARQYMNFFPFLCMKDGDSISVKDCIWEAQSITSASHPDHPGLDGNGDPLTGTVSREWIKIKDYDTVTITLPPSSVPGKLVGAVSDKKCPILVEFKIEEAFEINGSAGSGSQVLVLKPDDKAGLTAETVCHELGHSMGMAIFPGLSKKPPGPDDAKHVDESGTYYSNPWNGQTVGADGFRSGHKGKHCAKGVADLTQQSFFDKGGTCLMFGEGKLTESRAAYCAACLDYIKARNLVDLHSDWDDREDDDY